MTDTDWERWVLAGDPDGFAAARAESDEAPSLEGATFADLRIVGFDFSGADLSNTEWTNCMLEKVRFDAANLDGAYFDHTVLTECQVNGGTLEGASLDAVLLRRTDVEKVVLTATELEGCELTDCKLVDLDLDEVDWRQLSLTRVLLKNVRGQSGRWVDVVLREAEIDGVDLSGLDCKRCRASVTKGALPSGFEPLTGRRQRIR